MLRYKFIFYKKAQNARVDVLIFHLLYFEDNESPIN